MYGPPRVKSINFNEPETRPVLGPAGNKGRSIELQKFKSEKTLWPQVVDESKGQTSPKALPSPGMTSDKLTSPAGLRKSGRSAVPILMQRQTNLLMNASCSSDASTNSTHSRASTGKISRRTGTPAAPSKRKQPVSPKAGKIENDGNGNNVGVENESATVEGGMVKKRCAWVTSNTDPSHAAFHDEEWGLPIHDDKKLFELLSFSTALAELSWPVILSKRHLFRDVFLDFDPVAVSKLNEKKITTPGCPASTLLSELKLRAITENARQIRKIINEVGSFDAYIWSFVNYKPIVGNFRYPRQVPIKTSKADSISKDLVRRGFRGVGPTVIYSFMQVAGITNDHLISCFRHHDCVLAGDSREKSEGMPWKDEGKKPVEDMIELNLIRDIDDMCLSR